MRGMLPTLLAGVVLLSGCASMGPPDVNSNIDLLKIARIENAAKAVGVQVYWVNLPVKASTPVN